MINDALKVKIKTTDLSGSNFEFPLLFMWGLLLFLPFLNCFPVIWDMSINRDIMDLMKNYGSEFNMSTVMQCVQELKAWQDSQQQKLCKDPTMDTLTNEMEDVLKSFDIPESPQGK